MIIITTKEKKMYKVYALHDKASETFTNPIVLPSQRDAIEGLRIVTNDKQSPQYKFPADFTLFEIGNYDPRTGTFDPLLSKIVIVNAAALKEGITIKEE